MVDTTRGAIRMRSWPRKRPGPRHPTNEYWTKWLRAASYLYRYQPAEVQSQLMRATKNTVWMPRDPFISNLRGRGFIITDELGRKYYPMAAVQDVSESLDVIAQLPGDLMYRGESLWVPLHAGTPGQVLLQGLEFPEWADPPAGGTSYMVLPIWRGPGSGQTFSINNTAYVQNNTRLFNIDLDVFPFTHFRMLLQGNSNQAGVNVLSQIAQDGAPTVSIAAANDNLTITSSAGWHDSGWVERTDGATGLQAYSWVWRGANATVDVNVNAFELHLDIQ